MLHKISLVIWCFMFAFFPKASNGQRVLSEKTGPTFHGTQVTRVTADELGGETTTIEEYDRNKNLLRKSVKRKIIDGDKIITVTTDSAYEKSFLHKTSINRTDQNNEVLSGEWTIFDKEGYPIRKGKAERTDEGDYQFYNMDLKTDTWILDTLVNSRMIKVFLPKYKRATDYNLPFPETTPPHPENPGPISFGLKGGVNLASLHSENNDNTKNIVSFHAGAFASINVSGPLRFQPELLYSIQGCNSEFQVGSTKFEDKLRLHYILLPLMMQWYMSNGLFFEAGPQAGFLIKAQYKLDGETHDLLDQEIMNRVNFGINAGAGYLLARSALALYIRYHLGLSTIWEDDTEKARNRLLMIGLMYNFGRN